MLIQLSKKFTKFNYINNQRVKLTFGFRRKLARNLSNRCMMIQMCEKYQMTDERRRTEKRKYTLLLSTDSIRV
jgi:hypothetical protein